MSDRFTVTEIRTVTNEDGTPFARATIEYFGVRREQVLMMERELVATLQARIAWGEAAASSTPVAVASV